MTLAHGNDRLESERLLLRRIGQDDFEFFVHLHADPEVARYLSHGQPRSSQESLAWFQHLLGTYEDLGLGQLAVVRKADGMLIGRCGLSDLAVEARAGVAAVPRGWYQRDEAPAAERAFFAIGPEVWGATGGCCGSDGTPFCAVCVAGAGGAGSASAAGVRLFRYVKC